MKFYDTILNLLIVIICFAGLIVKVLQGEINSYLLLYFVIIISQFQIIVLKGEQ